MKTMAFEFQEEYGKFLSTDKIRLTY